MFGPRSLRDVERGVSEGVGFEPYEKRFLCGVDGVRLDPGSMEPNTGGVLALEVEPSCCCDIDCGTSLSNISERSRFE